VTTAPSSRDRLLDAAADLFYRDGVGVGVDALCRAAGVSKRSMYQLFPTKDEVVAASLDRVAPRYDALLLPGDDVRDPRDRVLHVFARLDELSTGESYRGCPFVSTAVEVKDPGHPASAVARRRKQALTDFFRHELARAGASDPDLLAQQLTIVFDGASVRAVVRAAGLEGLATATATALLTAAGL
jgi:AcrR family transcriptional regulator